MSFLRKLLESVSYFIKLWKDSWDTSLIIAFVLYPILDISPIILLIGGVSAAFFQSIPLKINNNLLIPLFSSFIMAVMLGLGL